MAEAGRGRRGEDLDRHGTMRVDIEELSGEIAVAQGRLRKLLEDAGSGVDDELREAHGEADHLCRDLQELVMKARLVPLGPVFRQFVRVRSDPRKEDLR